MKERISVENAAKMLGISAQAIRIGLQRNEVPFGFAIKTSKNRHVYHISVSKFYEYIGCIESEEKYDKR